VTHNGLFLVCRVLSRLCALPIEHVTETMRPLPVERVAGAPQWIRGLAIIRGVPVPVVDLARVLTAAESVPNRFVAVKAAKRSVVLAVDAVVGIRPIRADSLNDLPPLLQDANTDAVATIGTLDAELLVVLRGARLLPDAVWNALETSGVSA
jgi:purine-binding chemotaxis protein CheW